MKIAIDISSIVYGTGVSVYTKMLVENLIKLNIDNEYVLYGCSLRRSSEIWKFLSGLNKVAFEGRVFPIPPTLADVIWNWLHIFPIEKLVGKIDVFHSSDWAQPPSKAFKVTTIHDLAPLLYPELTHPRIVSAHKRRLRWVIKEVDRVIVPSETTLNDLVDLGYQRKKIEVISEGIDPVFTLANKRGIDSVKKKYRISGEYLLSIGVNKRKNTNRVVEAFEKLRSDIDTKLVIVGYAHEKLRKISGVIYTGHVEQSDMPALFSGAKALVYPSLYEGFGLPILEAYKCQIPVVTSNLGSMKEIGSGCAVLVDPYNSNSIADGIMIAVKDREKLITKGTLRLEKYSWIETARATVNAYEADR